MSSKSYSAYSYADDKYSDGGLSERKDEAQNSDIPDDGPALLLMNYDIVFVVDDSTSMRRGRPESRWQECRGAVSAIAQEAVKYDTDGVEVTFLNSNASKTCKSKYEVEKLFDSVTLGGGTPTGGKLRSLLDGYMTKLYESLDDSVLNSLPSKRLSGSPSWPTPSSTSFLTRFLRRSNQKTATSTKWTTMNRQTRVKPVVFIVLTDGEPTDDPKEVIVTFARALQLDQWPERQVGIQFVQVGDSAYAARALREMDDALKAECGRDMVDYTLYDPNAVHNDREEDPAVKGQLMKILLGAINERVDKQASGNVKKKTMIRGNSPFFSPPPNYHEATSSRY